MKIIPRQRVLAAPVHAAFPWPRQARFSFTDFLGRYLPHNIGQHDGIVCDPIADCLYMEPIFIKHNQCLPYGEDDFGNPSVDWGVFSSDLGEPLGVNLLRCRRQREMRFWEWEFRTNWETVLPPPHAIYGVVHQVNAQGFYFLIRPYGGAINGFVITQMWFAVFEQGQNLAWYSIEINRPRWIKVRYHGAEWSTEGEELQSVPLATHQQNARVQPRPRTEYILDPDPYPSPGEERPRYPVDGGEYIWLEVRYIGGVIQIRLDSGDTPFVIPAFHRDGAQSPHGLIWEFRFSCIGSSVTTFSFHPMKFLKAYIRENNVIDPVGHFTSQEFNIGFVPDPTAGPLFDVHHAWWKPPQYGTSIGVDQDGSLMRYRLFIQMPLSPSWRRGHWWSDYTVAIRAISFRYPELVRQPFGRSVELHPEEIIINSSFNYNDLSATAQATLRFNNFHELPFYYEDAPNVFWGEWANYNGHIAITVQAALDMFSENGTFLGSTGWYTLFTGYGNTQSVSDLSVGGRSTYTMLCYSRELSMQSPQFFLPWMDGWNIYYAAAYLANVAGVKIGVPGDSDLAFRDHVPDDPYGDDPTGDPSFFLPMGAGNTPLMRFPAGETPWNVLGKICRLIGFVRYFDVFGKLHFEKFTPEVPARPYKTFDLVDGSFGTGEVPNALSAIFQGMVQRNLLDVRNFVTLLGVDPFDPGWNTLIDHRADMGSIEATAPTAWGPTQPNYLGFRNSFVWADAQFADRDFIQNAADGLFRFLRLPSVEATYAGWLQPDIFPGTWVGVFDARSGSFDRPSGTLLPYLTLGVTHRIAKGQPPHSTLKLKFIPSFWNPKPQV